MPAINPNQFGSQLPIPGVDRDALNEGRPYEPYDPGPDYKRGEIGVGQRQMNFDRPDHDLEVGTGGLVGVSTASDPGWDDEAWRVGGAVRGTDPGGSITQTWERAPVRRFGSDTEIRTNQIQSDGSTVAVGPDLVESLRHEEHFLKDPEDYGEDEFGGDSDPEARPWVARVAGKNYLLEGHHRTVASRTRGTGEFDAHVIEGENWDDVLHGKFDLPRFR